MARRQARLFLPALWLVGAFATHALAQGERRILPGANPRQPISIDSERLEFADREQKMVYSGRVVARQGDSTLQSSVLTISLDANPAAPVGAAPPAAGALSNSQVRHMDAAGPVTVTSKDQVGRGDRGVYDKLQNKIFLIGNVSLTKGVNTAHGARLVYDLDSGHAQITGGVSSFFKPAAKTGADANSGARRKLVRAP